MATDEPLPIARVIIDGIVIPGDRVEQGGVRHDVDTGRATVTFLGVRNLETVYRHMENDDDLRHEPELVDTLRPLIDTYGALGVKNVIDEIARDRQGS